MNVKLSRWGNSLAVRIPASIASGAALEEGCSLAVELDDGGIRLVPTRRSPSIDELIAGMNSDNLHGEISTEGAVGNEAW